MFYQILTHVLFLCRKLESGRPRYLLLEQDTVQGNICDVWIPEGRVLLPPKAEVQCPTRAVLAALALG